MILKVPRVPCITTILELFFNYPGSGGWGRIGGTSVAEDKSNGENGLNPYRNVT